MTVPKLPDDPDVIHEFFATLRWIEARLGGVGEVRSVRYIQADGRPGAEAHLWVVPSLWNLYLHRAVGLTVVEMKPPAYFVFLIEDDLVQNVWLLPTRSQKGVDAILEVVIDDDRALTEEIDLKFASRPP